MSHGRASFIGGFQFQIAALKAAFFKSGHDFQYMQSLAAVCPAGPSGAKCFCHIGDTQAAAVFLIIEGQRDFLEAAVFRAQESDAPAEAVGIRNAQGTLCPIDFKFILSVIIHVKGGGNSSYRTVYKLKDTVYMGWNLHRNYSTALGFAGNGARFKGLCY